MERYDTEEEVRGKIDVVRMDDLARDLITIRADLLLRAEVVLTREYLLNAIIDPTSIIFDAVERVRAQVVDQIKTREVVTQLEALQHLKIDAYKCHNWPLHGPTLKKLGLA